MKGHIRRRGDAWQLKLDIGRNPAGRRVIEYRTFHGTKRQAQDKLAELIADLGKGAFVSRSAITVGAHVAERIDRWQQLGKITPKTAERYRELCVGQIAPHLGARLLQELRSADIERWHATLKTSGRKNGKGGLSAQTIRHAHRVLSKALKEAERHDLVVRNVAATEQPPKVERDEVTILTGDQVRDLVVRMKGRSMYAPAIVALFTGMRRAEVLALRWRHVDLDGKLIMVRETIEETKAGLRIKAPKSEAGKRDIALPDIVVETLRERRRVQLEQRLALGLGGKLTDDALLFPKLDGTPQSPRAFSKAWEDAAAAIGLGATFHGLRHTHASHLIDQGIDVVKISKRLGHADAAITLRVYAHVFARREDKSAAAINAAVETLLRT